MVKEEIMTEAKQTFTLGVIVQLVLVILIAPLIPT
jgi:hypothetical protein